MSVGARQGNGGGSRAAYAIAAGICLLAGLGTLVYTGPGRALLRGTMGDVLIVAFLYFLWGAIWPKARLVRALGVGGFAFGLETLQLYDIVGDNAPAWLRIAAGTTFDPIDLVAYTAGLVAASLGDWWWSQPNLSRTTYRRETPRRAP